jgi:hypothetical protein
MRKRCSDIYYIIFFPMGYFMTISDGRMTNDELERIWKIMVMA